MEEVLHVNRVKACGAATLDVTFSNGVRKKVDLTPYLDGEVFEPLRDPEFFARVEVDPVCKTVVWPNGADLAPEALLELPEVNEVGHQIRRKTR